MLYLTTQSTHFILKVIWRQSIRGVRYPDTLSEINISERTRGLERKEMFYSFFNDTLSTFYLQLYAGNTLKDRDAGLATDTIRHHSWQPVVVCSGP